MVDSEKVQYNRVLFRGKLGWVPRPGVVKGHCVDGSSLAFIVEELVARCAVSVVIPDDSPAALFTRSLDPLLSRRVKTVPCEPVLKKAQGLLAPVTEEYSVRFDGSGFSSETRDKKVYEALCTMYFEFLEYLLGMEYHTQIDIRLHDLWNAVSTIRGHCRSPRSRSVLAALEGLLRVYVPIDCDALVATPAASAEMVRLFGELVEDADYLRASKTAHRLGLPKKVARSLVLLRRRVETIVKSRRFGQLFTLGTKAVTAATKVPMPDSQAAVEILAPGFLPPVVSQRDALEAGLSSWERVGSDPLYPPGLFIKGSSR